MGIAILVIVILVLVVFYIIRIYNKVKFASVDVDKSFGSIEAYLEERFDMLTKVISAANEESRREIEMQTNITELRQGLQSAKTTDEKLEASLKIEQAMPNVLLTVENYPDPKFNESFRLVQRSILSIEDKLSAARRNFNAQVAVYNKLIVNFPAVFIAKIFNFNQKEMFEATERKRDDIDIDSMWG